MLLAFVLDPKYQDSLKDQQGALALRLLMFSSNKEPTTLSRAGPDINDFHFSDHQRNMNPFLKISSSAK